MAAREYFWPNMHMEIAGAAEDVYYHTLVFEVAGDYLHVAQPEAGFLPEDGARVKGRFVLGEALYSFSTTVEGRTWSEGEPLLILRRPSRLVRNQRRDYYRYPVILEAEYTLGGGDGDDQWVEAYTLDLGGGGMRLATDERLQEGTELKLRLYLPLQKAEPPELLETAGKIIRSFPLRAKEDKYVYAIQFTRIKEAQRDKIIGFIFALLRRRIR